MSFYVNLPEDEYGNTGYPKAVCELEPGTDDFGTCYRVLAPEEFARKWPSLSALMVESRWRETAGPARMLTREEHAELTATSREERKQIQGSAP